MGLKPSENGFAIYCLPHQSEGRETIGFRELSDLKSIFDTSDLIVQAMDKGGYNPIPSGELT